MSRAGLRRYLSGTAALLITPLAAHAQTSSMPEAPAAATGAPSAASTGDTAAAGQDVVDVAGAPAAEAAPADAIVVTGSRITRTQFNAPNPITSFDAAAIQQSGNTNITTFLQRIPALTGSRDFTQASGGNAVYANPFGGAGLNELNLRNLGTNRTLVLVNGRRHVAGEQNTAAVDINSIPTDLIQSVDVLTGGASAVYGADGVTGVVNFILKRDFNGVSARTQLGISQRGDAGNRFVSLIAGKTFADGRANLTLAFEHNEDDRVDNDARSYLSGANRAYLIPNDARTNGDATAFANVIVRDLRYPNESPIGAVDVNGDYFPDFNGLGQPYRHGTPSSYYSTGDSDDTPVAGFYSGDIAPKVVRNDVNLLGHFDVSDAFKISVEGKYARTSATTFDYYFGTYSTPISINNPFVPATIRDAALAADLAAGLDPATTPLNVTRDNIDYGRHGEHDLRQTYRGVIDVSGEITSHAKYDAYYEYGRTDTRITKLNDIVASRYAQALDAVTGPNGQIVCASGAPGCVPVSLFGPGPISQQALSFFQIDDTSIVRLTQQVADASISGDFGELFTLPGGPVQFSFGGEYRRETSAFNPSENLRNAVFAAYTEPTLVLPTRGSFDVKEAFGELNAPILQHVPWAETLAIGAAYRFSHYSTIGNTTTWQVNGIYAPVRDISFRGSYGKAVRAPNIGELFTPLSGTSVFIVDPCTPSLIDKGTQYRAANCAATLAAVGGTVSAGLQTPSNIFGTTSGNTALKAEEATTWTAGVVLRPRFVPGLTASFDWYDIKLRDAINTVDASQLAGLCVDQQTLDNPYCGLITRLKGTQVSAGSTLIPGTIVGFSVQPVNVASFRTSGLDVNIDYAFTTARAGSFDLRLIGGYLHRLTQVPIVGAPTVNNLGQPGRPKFSANFSPTWTLGPLTVNYNLRWQDGARIFDYQTTLNDPLSAERLRSSDVWQHDLQVGYDLESGMSFYLGVLNLTDQKPDPGNSISQPVSAIGRSFYVGVRIRPGAR